MKNFFLTIVFAIALSPIGVNAKIPIEYTLNSSGIGMEMTSKDFVIENYGDDFATGNLVVMIDANKKDDFPTLSFMFDDLSSKNRSSNLLKKEKTPLKFVFEDGTTLSATGYIKKGYGGFSPVSLACCISNLRMPSESPEISKSRNSRNISILTTKKIKQVQAGDYILNVRSSVSSDPLFNSVEIFNDMFSDLQRRYPNHLNLNK